MRKKLLAIVFATALMLALAVPVFGGAVYADNLGPCNDSGEPGNSDYAVHHIRFLAKNGSLGVNGHVPGNHQGVSTCL